MLNELFNGTTNQVLSFPILKDMKDSNLVEGKLQFLSRTINAYNYIVVAYNFTTHNSASKLSLYVSKKVQAIGFI